MISHTYQSKPPVAWALAFTAIVLAATLFGGCTEPLAPMLPEWDVDANMPLVNHTYTMEDLLQEDDILRITQNGDQVLVVTQRYPLQSICIGDHLRVDDVSFLESESFDAVRFDMPEYLDQHLDVFTLFPVLPRGEQVVSAITNDLGISIAIDTREYFEEMTFAKGRLLLHFTNHTPIPLRIEAIRLVDLNGATIGSITYSVLVQPEAQAHIPAMMLDGLTLVNNMRLAFDISSPGSAGKSVTVNASHSLAVEGEVRDTDILSVRGYVPAQEFSYPRFANIAGSSGLRIKEAQVRSGTVHFSVKNHFAVGAQITMTLDDVRRGGTVVTSTAYVDAHGTKSILIDLSGTDVRLRNETQLSYQTHIVTEDASDRIVTVTRNDSVSVTGQIRDVHLASMTGTLAPTAMRIREMEESDFYPGKSISGSMELSEARMWASIRNQAYLPVGITDASVLGKNTTGSSATLRINPRDLAGKSETMITFENNQVVNFLNSFSPEYPDSIGVEGTFVLNPTAQHGSVSAADSVVGDLYIEFPLRFTQISGSVVDTVDMMIDEDTRRKLTEVNEGTLSFDVENHLPSAVTIEPAFLDSAGRLLLTPVSTSGEPLRVAAAPVDASGFVSRALIERVTLHFTDADFGQLAKAESIRFRITFDASESGGAAFRTTDYVRIRGYARLNISSTITEK
ncbi:MAG: hypothetical protein JXA28_11215 [Bacteroidetes bacterium]|nr:hypothetical protein [Bacteroidota bacterium]